MIYSTELFDVNTVGNNLQFLLKKNIHEMTDEEFVRLGIGSSISSAILFEVTKSQGTNIIIDENEIKVVARRIDDGIDIGWNPINLDKVELQASFQSIVNALKPVETQVVARPVEITKTGNEVVYDENNYMVRHLKRQA